MKTQYKVPKIPTLTHVEGFINSILAKTVGNIMFLDKGYTYLNKAHKVLITVKNKNTYTIFFTDVEGNIVFSKNCKNTNLPLIVEDILNRLRCLEEHRCIIPQSMFTRLQIDNKGNILHSKQTLIHFCIKNNLVHNVEDIEDNIIDKVVGNLPLEEAHKMLKTTDYLYLAVQDYFKNEKGLTKHCLQCSFYVEPSKMLEWARNVRK